MSDNPTPKPITPPPSAKSDGDTRPPKKGAAKETPKSTPPKEPKAKSTTKRPAGRPRELEKKLREFFEGIATVVLFINPDDAQVIEQNAEALAHAYANLAAENATVKRIIERMLETSAWGEAIMVTGMVALPIAANHNLIPSGFPMPINADPSKVPDA